MTTGQISLCVLIAFIAWSAEATSASAGARTLRAVANVAVPAVSDRERWFAYVPDGDDLVIRNARTGAVAEVPLPGDCAPLSVSHGAVLVSCDDPNASPPYVASVAERSARAVAGWAPRESYTSIGRYWLAGVICTVDPHAPTCGQTVYLNWRTGEKRTTEQSRRDLDSTTLDEAPARPRSLLDLRLRRSARDRAVEHFDLVLRGPRDKRVVSRCSTACVSPLLLRGTLTWGQGRTIYAYTWRTRRKTAFKLPSGVRSLVVDRAGQTLLVTARTASGAEQLVVGRLP